MRTMPQKNYIFLKPDDFFCPTLLPKDTNQQKLWQKKNYEWWENHPMCYNFTTAISYPEFTKEFYLEIDRRFFSSAWEYLPWSNIPFDQIIDYPSLKNKIVLEIGIGNGSHAQLLAAHAGSFTGIDISNYAVKSTTARMQLFHLKTHILKMDVEQMIFPDNSFDFIWSWGVIHHSANTKNALEEIARVLKPKGKALIMVYHRGWWNYYCLGFLQGLQSGSLKKNSLHKNIQYHTDGALARYYTPAEFQNLASDYFSLEKLKFFGPKYDIIPLPASLLKNTLTRFIPIAFSRFLTSQMRMGSFLVAELIKK